MKITIEKVCRSVVDTTRERKRIATCLGDDKVSRDKLNLFMDAIEQGKWRQARQMLGSKWWQGYDKKVHCRRLEFIGCLFDDPRQCEDPPALSFHTGYAEFAYIMHKYPKNFKVVKKEA